MEGMVGWLSSIIGYVVNFLYNLINNYGLAIIIFSFLLRLILIPFTIKQQRVSKMQARIQEESKAIQRKYKNDPETMNNEIMAMYKRNNMSPLSGCLPSILQIFVILAVFFVVSKPLTYMRKADKELINHYTQIVTENNNGVIPGYHEIAIVKYVNALDDSTEENKKAKEELSLNMSFLGLDLSNVPKDHLNDWTVYVIPVLYILTSIVSIRLTTKEQDKMKKKAKENATSRVNKGSKVIESNGKEISKNSKEEKAKIVKDNKEEEKEKEQEKDKVKDTKESKEEKKDKKEEKVEEKDKKDNKDSKDSKDSKDNKDKKEDKENKEEKALVKKDDKNDKATPEDYENSMNQMSKSMLYMMPIMSVMIAFIAPLGLALYWLVSNICMIVERIFISKYLDKEEDKKNGK